MVSVVSGCGRSLYCMFYLQNWCRNSLDVVLFSLGYGAVLLCSSVGGGGRGCGVVDLRGCSGESCVVYPRSTQVKLRGDLLSWVASVMYPTIVFDRTSPTFYFTNTSGWNTSSSKDLRVLPNHSHFMLSWEQLDCSLVAVIELFHNCFFNQDFEKQEKKVTKLQYIPPHSRHHGTLGDGMCQVLYSD